MNVGDYIIIKDNIVSERLRYEYSEYQIEMLGFVGKRFKIKSICVDCVRIEDNSSFFIPKTAIETPQEVRLKKIKQIFE